jgi:tRNA(Phe) wybutosine-synthesizing methylase Tyw3
MLLNESAKYFNANPQAMGTDSMVLYESESNPDVLRIIVGMPDAKDYEFKSSVGHVALARHGNLMGTPHLLPCTTMRRSKSPLPQSFVTKKKTILDQLSVPASEYGDLSPKGSIDEGIRELIDEINLIEGCVTTSSCSGRISVFLEGKKHVGEGVLCDQVRAGEDKGVVRGGQDEMPAFTEKGKIKETRAGVGGKGGGRWLYVSHSEVETNQHELAGGLAGLLGMEVLQEDPPRDAGRRFIHFKFEPMVSVELSIYILNEIEPLLMIFRSFMSLPPLLSTHKLSSQPLSKLGSARAVPST